MDLLLDEDNDLTIVDGDFEIGEDTAQRVELILQAQQGHFKQNPLTGAGLRQAIAGTLTGALKRTIQLQLEADGINLASIRQNGEQINIDLR
jgi:hypothetical protein